MTTEEQKENTRKIERYYDEMVKDIDFINVSQRGVTENISKTILTFTSGIIGLSVVFSSDMIKDTTFLWLLFISWGLLMFSGSIILFVFFYRKREYEQEGELKMERYDKFKKELKDIKTDSLPSYDKYEKYRKKNWWWTSFSVFLFIFGLLFFIIFAIFTLYKSNSDYDEKNNHRIHNCISGAIN